MCIDGDWRRKPNYIWDIIEYVSCVKCRDKVIIIYNVQNFKAFTQSSKCLEVQNDQNLLNGAMLGKKAKNQIFKFMKKNGRV